jgi:hypothetical protein
MNEYPQVGKPRVGQKTSTIAEPEEAPPAPSSTVTVCYFNGDPYSRGAVAVSLPVVAMEDGTLPEIVDDNRSRIAFTRVPSK